MAAGPLPVLAVVGRPNVGKSTLVNRIIGRREAVVEDKPGVTRDRVTYEAEWAGRRFKVVDTGGWEQDVLGIDASVAAQAEYAIEAADAVVFVVDATVGATDTDEAVVKLLRRAGKPVVLCANKVDGPSGEADAAALWSLGLGEPHPVSALHGRGTGDMLDAVLEALPEAPADLRRRASAARAASPSIGRPNVGKSSLLNKVAGEERVVVNEIAGHHPRPGRRADRTRRHDLEVRRHRRHPPAGPPPAGRRLLRLAAHRRRRGEGRGRGRPDRRQRVHQRPGPADHHDGRGRRAARWSSRTTSGTRSTRSAATTWSGRSSSELVQVAWAPRVNVSARTGRHMEKLVPAIETALAGWETRVPTGRLNAFLGEIVAAHPHPVRGGKQPRILFGTQAGTKPPRFVLFASGFLEAGLPPLHRAPAARGVRLRGHADPDLGAGAREAGPVRPAGDVSWGCVPLTR